MMRLRIESAQEAQHPGGINLFGKQFGDYDQDIEIRCLRKGSKQ